MRTARICATCRSKCQRVRQCAVHRGGVLAGPIRRSRFDGIEGRQASRGGDSPQGFPLEGKRSAQRRRRGETSTGRSKKKRCAAPWGRRTEGCAAQSVRRRRRHRLQLVDHARLYEHASLLVLDRHVEHLGEHRAPQMGQSARAICLLGLHAAAGR